MSRRTPSARVLAVVLLSGTVAAALGAAAWTWERARSPSCEDLPREDLSLREMAQLRRRLEDYEPASGAPLVLSGREFSFLVREQFDLPAWFAVNGGQVSLEARIAQDGRCWNVGFRGTLEVDRGQPYVVPDELRVGKVDVGWWLRGRRLELPRSLVPGGGTDLGQVLDHLVEMSVVDGDVYVRLDDDSVLR